MSIIACHLAPWHSSVHAQQRSFWPSGLLCQLPSFKLGAPAGSTSNAAGAIASSCASSVPGRGSKGRSGARGCLQRGARRAQHGRQTKQPGIPGRRRDSHIRHVCTSQRLGYAVQRACIDLRVLNTRREPAVLCVRLIGQSKAQGKRRICQVQGQRPTGLQFHGALEPKGANLTDHLRLQHASLIRTS